MADTLSGTGTISAVGGKGGSSSNLNGGIGGSGRIRLETTRFNFTGTLTGVGNNGGLGPVFLPNPPRVNIVSVDGVAIAGTPQGIVGGTDVIVNAPGTLPIVFNAAQVPVGTTISVTAKPETNEAAIGPVTSGPLTGTLADSTVTVNLLFPTSGLYFLEARATFTLP
jgi:hypothetical protein